MFDPTLPQEGTPLDAVQMRNQLNGLKALIDAILTVTAAQVDITDSLPSGSPANASVNVVGNTMHFSFAIPQGQEGPMGQQGPAFSTAVVDSVTTLNPGDSATVGVSFDGTNVRFTFGIPRGNDGSQGPQGNTGNDGGQGPQGVQGPPFAQAVVDAVNTLDPGQPASVGVSFDGSNVRFTFSIPRGSDGSNGTNGNDGSQGPPGEISQAQLATAISGTSANTNNVGTLGQGADGSYNPNQMQDVLNKLDELINALRR